MSQPLQPSHRSPDCTGSWVRHLMSEQAIWQCNRCGYAYPESLPVLGAVRTDSMLTDLLAELAADGAEILARVRRGPAPG